MNNTEYNNKKPFVQFIEQMLELKFLVKYKEGLALSTPFEIELPSKLAKKVTGSYKNNEETGGLFFAKIYIVNNIIRLTIEEWHEVENITEKVNPKMSKSNSYLGDQQVYKRLLEDNFSKQASEILFPIHYHTHPTVSLESDPMSFSSVSKLNLSKQDMIASDNRGIKIDNNILYYVSAIITGRLVNEKLPEHRIIYYGKGISPYDFTDIRMQQGSKAIIETISELEEPWKKALAAIGFGLYGLGTAALATQHHFGAANDMKDILADFISEKQYFSIINSFGPTIVKLPKYTEKPDK